MLKEFTLKTGNQSIHPITEQVRRTVKESGVKEGICVVFCPHTTAGITINENSDPDVQTDLLYALSHSFPDHPQFRHDEGNSAAHTKSTCTGASSTVIIHEGQLVLGIWQAIYFCEYDGPRTRKFYVKVMEG